MHGPRSGAEELATFAADAGAWPAPSGLFASSPGMALSCSKKSLSGALRLARRGLGVSPGITVARITASGATGTVTVAGVSTTIRVSFDAADGAHLDVLVDAHKLAVWLWKLPASDAVWLAADGAGTVLAGSTNTPDAEVKVFEQAIGVPHFPPPPSAAPDAVVSARHVKVAASRSLICAGDPRILPVLAGTGVDAVDGQVTVRSTDRYLLAVTAIPATDCAGFGLFPLGHGPLRVLAGMPASGDARFTVRDRRMWIAAGGVEVCTVAGDQDYPGVEPVIRALAEKPAVAAVVDAREMSGAVKQLLAAGSRFDRDVVFLLDGDRVAIGAELSEPVHLAATVSSAGGLTGVALDGEKVLTALSAVAARC